MSHSVYACSLDDLVHFRNFGFDWRMLRSPPMGSNLNQLDSFFCRLSAHVTNDWKSQINTASCCLTIFLLLRQAQIDNLNHGPLSRNWAYKLFAHWPLPDSGIRRESMLFIATSHCNSTDAILLACRDRSILTLINYLFD